MQAAGAPPEGIPGPGMPQKPPAGRRTTVSGALSGHKTVAKNVIPSLPEDLTVNAP